MSLPYFEVDTRNERLRTLAGKHSSLWKEFNHKLDYSWVYHDHGLEGVVLQPQELEYALSNKHNKNEALSPLHQEIKNFYDAIQLIRDYATGRREKERYSKSIMVNCYTLLSQHLRGVSSGDGIRKEDSRYGAYYHKSCHYEEIEPNLKRLIAELNQTSAEEVHPLVSAARLHYRMMRWMPFGRFSGKITRLFTNMWLLRNHYPPVILHTVDRARYYESLTMPDETALLSLMRDALNATVESGLNFIEKGLIERKRKREARKLRRLQNEQKNNDAKPKKKTPKKKTKKTTKSKTTKAKNSPKEQMELTLKSTKTKATKTKETKSTKAKSSKSRKINKHEASISATASQSVAKSKNKGKTEGTTTKKIKKRPSSK